MIIYCLKKMNPNKKTNNDEVNTFINEVRLKGSKLPDVEIEKYVCKTIL